MKGYSLSFWNQPSVISIASISFSFLAMECRYSLACLMRAETYSVLTVFMTLKK